MKYPEVRNYVGGTFVAPGREALDVFDPSSGSVISRVPLSSARRRRRRGAVRPRRVSRVVATPIKERVQVFYRYKALLEQHIDELAALVTEENGKITSEARAEVSEVGGAHASSRARCRRSHPGEVLEVSRGVECRVERFPVGVVAAITPFNFPNMVPNWSIPNAIALGNCMILKPSELVPLSAGRIAELLREAGLPDGRAPGRARRAGDGRGDVRSSGHRGGQLRRIDEGREDRVPARDGEPQALSRARRREEPSHRDAGRGP